MYFILKGAKFPNTIGTITVTEGSVGSGGTSGGGTVSNYKFKVTATPSTATVKLEAAGYTTVTKTGSAEITVASGTAVKYTVSASGYVTKSATVTVAYGQTLPVTLNKEGSSGGSGGATTNYTFTITPNPTSATVTLSATGYSNVSGTGSKSITVANGTTVNWKVSASGYTTRTGSWTISGGNKTENIVLTASSGGESGIINYFNPDDPDINETHYMNHEGVMTEGGETLGWSGYIACSPGETYYAYYNKNGTYAKYPPSMVTFFDASKNRISGLRDDDYLVPEGAAYFKAPFSKARRYNDFMFIKSPDVPTTFIPYNAG